MAWPAALTVKSLHGKVSAADSAQTPAVGYAFFEMPHPLTDSAEHVIIAPAIFRAQLVDGEFTIELPASNAPGISPSGWTYKVRIDTDVLQWTFPIEVPHDAVGTIELPPPAVDVPAVVTFALYGHTHEGYAEADHTHDFAATIHGHSEYVTKATATTKGDVLVATGAGTLVRLPVGANGRVFTADSSTPEGVAWLEAAGGGGVTHRGTWAPATEYQPGDIVEYGDATYFTAEGAAADDAPFEEMTWFSGVPTSIDVGDSDPYQFRALTVPMPKRLRVTGLCYYKVATQVEVPHELRVYDPAFSTISPLASVTVPGEVSNAVGQQVAPIVGDLRIGHSYAFMAVVGAGGDAGYRYQAGFGFGSVGSMQITAGGYSTSHANITTISSPTTLYAGVSPRWEEPSDAWVLIGRHDPVFVGTNRAMTLTPR